LKAGGVDRVSWSGGDSSKSVDEDGLFGLSI